MNRALLLDFDGTIADTLSALRTVYEDVLASHGMKGSAAEFAACNGPPLQEIAKLICQRHNLKIEPQALAEDWLRRAKAATYEAPAAPGALRLLEAARTSGWKTAVVTSGLAEPTSDWLRRNDMSALVDVVVGSNSVVRGKPAPDPYVKALDLLGADSQRSIAVEDSVTGAKSAVAAGVMTMLLTENTDRQLPPGALPVRHLPDVQCLIEHDFLSAHPLPETFMGVACCETAAPISPDVQEQVDQIWSEAISKRSTLVDGLVSSVVQMDHEGVRASPARFRYVYAQLSRPDLGRLVRPLAVTGLVCCRDGLLLARRSARTSSGQALWELAPSGSVDWPGDSADRIDLASEIVRELTEELGIPKSSVTRSQSLQALVNERTGLTDIALWVEICLSGDEVVRLFEQRNNDEYEALSIVRPKDVGTFCHRIGWQVVDTTALLIRQMMDSTVSGRQLRAALSSISN